MRKLVLCFGVLIWTTGCFFFSDPGSDVDSELVGDAQCRVSLESNASGFTVEMLLACDGSSHTECYTIEELACDGENIELAVPIALESCPDGGWCVDECTKSPAGGNASIWDTPELLDVDGCNVYDHQE